MAQDKTDKIGVRRRTRYPDSMREQAVRMVGEARRDDGLSLWEACTSVSKLLGPHAESIRQWVARGEVDAGVRPGVTLEASEELKRLRRENVELRRANEILKAAASSMQRPRLCRSWWSAVGVSAGHGGCAMPAGSA